MNNTIDPDLATFNSVLEKMLATECDRLRDEVGRLQCNLDAARYALRSLYAWHGTSALLPQTLRNSVLAVLGNNAQSD